MTTRYLHPAKILLLLVAIAHLSGCARSVATISNARQAFAVGDLTTASVTLQEVASNNAQVRETAELDMAVIELATGAPSKAERRLRAMRDQFDAAKKINPLSDTAAVLTDDNAKRFRPAGYEEVMIRTMLAICSLAGDQVDAESYTLQAINRQATLAAKANKRGLDGGDIYQPIAIAPYLRGVLREATHHDYDDASRYYQLASTVQPDFSAAAADIARSKNGTHSTKGNGVLYVISCVGRGPILQETTAPTTTATLAIASSVLNSAINQTRHDKDHQATEHSDARNSQETDEVPALPNIASVKVPEVVIPESPVASVGIIVNGEPIGKTETLTNVADLAIRQNQAEMPWTIARAIVRRVTKEATVAAVGDAMGLEGTAGSLFHFATASAWSGMEKADTRCWGLLPREIQVLRTELPAGVHQVQVVPLGRGGGPLAGGIQQEITITNGRNQYLMVMAPTEKMHVVHRPRSLRDQRSDSVEPLSFSLSD
ncbi:MAG: hypothetical protein CMM01_16895 [Rhodopirellula sp.]|nr:hypothetical protein [Rhodopirellula sp.]